MVKGWPDFTVPISIEAVTIETLPINIKTQTLPVLKIDIAAQTMGNININLVGGIHEIGYFSPIVNPEAEDGMLGWTIRGTVVSTDEYQYSGRRSFKFPAQVGWSAILQPNIKNVPTDDIEEFYIWCMRMGELGANVYCDVFYSDGGSDGVKITPTEELNWEKFEVPTTAGKYIIEIQIYTTTSTTADFYVDGLMLRLRTQVYVGTAPTVNLNVDIKAQTVDINIKTSGGANIIIDKLTQTAYTERRSTLTNDGGTIIWDQPLSQNRQGKFFPRGARGFIDSITAYCYDSGASGGTLSVLISPHPNMGPIWTGSITIPPGGAAAWRSVDVRRMWNYDSMFVMFYLSQVALSIACDSSTPYDCFGSGDYGATWQGRPYRFFVRVVMHGETVGDIPVSGVVNIIEIPQTLSSLDYCSVEVPGQATGTLLSQVNGIGTLSMFQAFFYPKEAEKPVTRFQMYLRITVDGTLFELAVNVYATVCGDVTKTISPVSFTRYDEATNKYGLAFNFPIRFKRSLLIEVRNSAVAANNLEVEAVIGYDRLT